MNDYEAQYQEYKQSLLRSSNFRSELIEKYNNTSHTETSYIDSNGVFFKIGSISAVFGFCLSICWSDAHLAIRIAFALIGVVCFFLALYIGSQFKEQSGKSNFYAYVYYRHLEDRVRFDKELEARNLVRDFIGRQIDRDEFQTKYENLYRYDRFAKDLKDDFSFNTEIQKHL